MIPWEQIEPYVPEAQEIVARMLAARGTGNLRPRYEAGAREHGDDLTKWSFGRFADETYEELDDAVNYMAAALYVESLR